MVGRNKLLEVGQRAASVLRESHASDRIKQGYTRINPLEIAEQADVWVMLKSMDRLLGAFLSGGSPGILLNVERPPGMIHMTCAHELGHFFLEHETTYDQRIEYDDDAESKEREADWFAYQLLMPRWLVVNLLRRKGWLNRLRSPSIIYQLSLRLGTSYTATVWTLRQHNLLNLTSAEAKKLAGIPPKVLKQDLIGGGEGVPSDVWLLDDADKNLILEPRPNDQFVLEVPSQASAGYLWSLDDAKNAGYTMHPLTRIARADDPHEEGPIIIGSASKQRYLLEPIDGGEAAERSVRVDLDFSERQPWQKEAKAINCFRTSAEFETLTNGLSDPAKERLIGEVHPS